MPGLLLIVIGSLLVTTSHGYDYDGYADGYDDYGPRFVLSGINSKGVQGCTGKLLVTPSFKKGDIE